MRGTRKDDAGGTAVGTLGTTSVPASAIMIYLVHARQPMGHRAHGDTAASIAEVTIGLIDGDAGATFKSSGQAMHGYFAW